MFFGLRPEGPEKAGSDPGPFVVASSLGVSEGIVGENTCLGKGNLCFFREAYGRGLDRERTGGDKARSRLGFFLTAGTAFCTIVN